MHASRYNGETFLLIDDPSILSRDTVQHAYRVHFLRFCYLCVSMLIFPIYGYAIYSSISCELCSSFLA